MLAKSRAGAKLSDHLVVLTATVAAMIVAADRAYAEPGHGRTLDEICNTSPDYRGGRECGIASPLIGKWTNPRHGGLIEVYREPDGTVSGWIVATNDYMLREGYRAGMEIFRRYRLAPADVTWLGRMTNGEYLSAARSDRKPGEQYGVAKWESTVVFIERRKPDVLQIPAQLSRRFGNYEDWVRAPANAVIANTYPDIPDHMPVRGDFRGD